jgi:hypothetical protein
VREGLMTGTPSTNERASSGHGVDLCLPVSFGES